MVSPAVGFLGPNSAAPYGGYRDAPSPGSHPPGDRGPVTSVFVETPVLSDCPQPPQRGAAPLHPQILPRLLLESCVITDLQHHTNAWGQGPAHPRDGETEASTGCSLPTGWSDAIRSRRTWWQLGATPGPSGSEGVRVAWAEEMGEPWPGSHSPPPAAPPPRSCLTPRQAGRGATIAVPIAGCVPVPTMLRLLLLCVALGCRAECAGKARTQ